MSRRRGEFEHRTSIFEGAFRGWCYLGQLSPNDLFTKRSDEFDPLIALNEDGEPLPTVDGRSSAGDDYTYEPLPRTGMAHPFVKAILSPWLGPDADCEAMELGLTTLRTWWQHRRKGESGTAVNALGTDRMRSVVDGYTRHFFNLAHVLIVQEQEQPPRRLQSKLRALEKSGGGMFLTRPAAMAGGAGSRRSSSIVGVGNGMGGVNISDAAAAAKASLGVNVGVGIGDTMAHNRNSITAATLDAATVAGLTAANPNPSLLTNYNSLHTNPLRSSTHHQQAVHRGSITRHQQRGSITAGLTLGQMHAGSSLGAAAAAGNLLGGQPNATATAALYNYNPGFAPGYGSELALLGQQPHALQSAAARRTSISELNTSLGVNPMMAEFASLSHASQRAHRGSLRASAISIPGLGISGNASAGVTAGQGMAAAAAVVASSEGVKQQSEDGCCATNNGIVNTKNVVQGLETNGKMPIVFVHNKQDVQIGIEVDEISDMHCVKIVETVLKGPPSAKKSPIEGLQDAVADKTLRFVLIKIDRSSNAKRIAAEVKRNLALVGYTAKVKQMSVKQSDASNNKKQKSPDLNMLFDAFEAVGSTYSEYAFKWHGRCSCFDNTERSSPCERHTQMTRQIFEKFQDREKKIQEYMKGCLMRYGGDCSCDSNCSCVGCPIHDPKAAAAAINNNPAQNNTAATNNAISAATQSQNMPRQMRRRSGGRMSRHSFTMNRGSFSRTMSGLSNISIDWDNMEDFDVNVDHSAGVVHNNLKIAEGCNMLNGGECNCEPSACKCSGCPKNASTKVEETPAFDPNTPIGHKRKRFSLRKQREALLRNGGNPSNETTSSSVSFKL